MGSPLIHCFAVSIYIFSLYSGATNIEKLLPQATPEGNISNRIPSSPEIPSPNLGSASPYPPKINSPSPPTKTSIPPLVGTTGPTSPTGSFSTPPPVDLTGPTTMQPPAQLGPPTPAVSTRQPPMNPPSPIGVSLPPPSDPTKPPTTTSPSPPAISTTPGQAPTTGASPLGRQWCIANQSASPMVLQSALDFVCGKSGSSCSAIQPGASCYEPNTIRDHASYAFNELYQKHPTPDNCNFGGAAQLITTDPSKGNCRFASSAPESIGSSSQNPTSQSTPKTTGTPPMTQSPPGAISPTWNTAPSISLPGGPKAYEGVGSPIEYPNSVMRLSCSPAIIAAATGLVVLLTNDFA